MTILKGVQKELNGVTVKVEEITTTDFMVEVIEGEVTVIQTVVKRNPNSKKFFEVIPAGEEDRVQYLDATTLSDLAEEFYNSYC